MTCFGLKSGQDLKNRVAHPHQEFPGVFPPQGNLHFPLRNLVENRKPNARKHRHRNL